MPAVRVAENDRLGARLDGNARTFQTIFFVAVRRSSAKKAVVEVLEVDVHFQTFLPQKCY